MKFYYVICCWIICSFSLFSQTYDLSGLHGLKGQKGTLELELSGYQIFISEEKGEVNDEEIVRTIKKKYKIKNILTEYRDSGLDVNNKVIEALDLSSAMPDIEKHLYCYILDSSETGVSVMCFYTCNPRDTELERGVIREYLANDLVDYIDKEVVSSIVFAGREIQLGERCKWTSPHTISCMGGQITWSEFSSYEKALQDNDLRIMIKANIKNIVILLEEEIEVLFEGVLTMAYRVVYAQKRTYPLVVYYVADEIRGRYISCVLSNYGYNRYDYELSPLLEHFMSIPELQEDAHNIFNIPEIEQNSREYNLYNRYGLRTNVFEIRTGTWLPIGNLKNRFGIAPSIGLLVGLPIQNFGIDLCFQMAFPVNRQPFEYYYSNNEYDFAKTGLISNVGGRIRYQITLAENIYLTPYFFYGINEIQTNLKKETYKDKEDEHYHVNASYGLAGGFVLRHKRIGCFFEYHYSPYYKKNEVKKDFGSSAINMGISVSI